MTPDDGALALLDGPAPAAGPNRADWFSRVEQSLGTEPGRWLGPALAGALDQDRAWRLLSWVEGAASAIADGRTPGRVSLAALAMSLLEASPLDRRDVMVVAALVRRAAEIAGLDYPQLVRAGCAAAGSLGEECLQWLWWASSEVPSTYEEVGSGASTRFRRKPSDIDIARLEGWLKGS